MKLLSTLLHPAHGDAQRVCIIDHDRGYTRAQAVSAVATMVDMLRAQGVARGQRVLALLEHDAVGVFFLAAASALGLRLLMPYNLAAAASQEWCNIATAARPDCAVYLKDDASCVPALQDCGTKVVCLPQFKARIASSEPNKALQIDALEPVANFLVLFTSGTTGAPKAISISESLVCQRVLSVSSKLKFDAKARIFMSGLLNNTTGVIFSFGALLHDACLIFPRSRDLASWPAQVACHAVTHMMLRPIALRKFVDAALADPVDLSSLQMVAYGAAAMPRALLEEARSLMPCEWMQGYGLSETYGPFCWLDEAAHQAGHYRRQSYCVGKPDATMEVAIRCDVGESVGEVMLRGTGLMEGYYDVAQDHITPVNNWLATGDFGCFNADGELLLKGRIDNTVMSENGHRIYPEEVEAVLASMAGVSDAILLAVPGQETLQTRPVACISGSLAQQSEEAIRHSIGRAMEQSLSREKWPDWIYASAMPFPKNGNDKVQRAEVMRQVLQHQRQEGAQRLIRL